MSLLDPSSPHFRYIPLSLYSTEIFIVLIILCIELKTFYYSVFHQQQLEMTIQSSKHSSVTTPHPGPTSDIESPPICSDSSIAPESPRSQTATSRTSPTSPKSSSNKSSSDSQLVFILPMLSYILFIGAALCGNLSVLGIKGCEITGRAGPSCYFIAKMFMYLVFIYRLYIVYSDSAFAYNNKILLILLLFVVIYTIFIVIINLLTLEIGISYELNNGRVCNAYGAPAVLMTTAFFDTMISALCCYLFIKPLMILNNHEINKHSTRMYKMILKYVVLTFVAVTTTFLLLGLMTMSKISSLLAIDIVINCICIALFNKYYHYYYKGICCGAIKLCNTVCTRKK
eukprot:518626_1